VGAVLQLVLIALVVWALNRAEDRVTSALRRYRASAHEAGHAVAVLICGFNLTGVHITQVRKGNRQTLHGECACNGNNVLSWIVISYAGRIAETKACPFLLGRHGGKIDHSHAEKYLDAVYLAVRGRTYGLTKNHLRKHFKREARSLVNEHWHSIVKVAAELRAKRALTGEEVKALVSPFEAKAVRQKFEEERQKFGLTPQELDIVSSSDPVQQPLDPIPLPLIVCVTCGRRIAEHSEDEFVSCLQKNFINTGAQEEAWIRELFSELMKLSEKTK
jgi:hypothetical protein